MNPFRSRISLLFLFLLIAFPGSTAMAQVVISEIMYHPVEEPAFNGDGSPVLELYEDVHEFIEIFNAGTSIVDLSGWKLGGGIDCKFPAGSSIQPGEYRVIAKNPARLAAVAEYQLGSAQLLGPYAGQLSNSGETVRLENAEGALVDAVRYSAEFPWAISADALGAGEDFTGIDPRKHQYRGRSLERVSISHPANDPANWLASPLPGNPSPGKPNAISRAVPKPVILRFGARQAADEAALIRAGQPVKIDCTFSGTQSLSNVRVEWFIDDINVTGEPVTAAAMVSEGAPSEARFAVTLPGQADRSILRYRFHADRGEGDEVVSPRADDPFAWHACFVTPNRTSSQPVYDCFIATSSLSRLSSNISQSPRRVTTPDPPGTPRASWNATEPAVVVHDGIVYDARARYHGSRYNRSAGRNSFKWQFPRYKKFHGVTGIFETDKGNDFIVGHNLFIQAGFPVSKVRYVDLYLNGNARMTRLEQGEFDGDLLDEFHKTQQRLNPGSARTPSGEIYKSVGTIDLNGEGPYGRGDGRKLAKPPFWTDLQMYDWTYSLQNNGWVGSHRFKQMIDAFWEARGDTPSAPKPNVPAMRAFFLKYFDIEEMLNYIAVENWSCPWDDTTQNHFLWQQRNGKWGMLPWDCDAWFGRGDNTPASSSIFIGEVGDKNNNFRGPNFFKDGFIKSFREELKQRFFLLNNTLLHPENITAMGFGSIRSFADQRFAAVNTQCGYGVFQRPATPANLSPGSNETALPPALLRATAYSHSSPTPAAHARTVWEIRTADGSYRAPLWKFSSTTNLTSIPIPFEQLRFGSRYFWRCTYYDADEHPSIPSPETAFVFGQAPAEAKLISIDASTPWKFQQAANLNGIHWTAPGYDDSAWSSGPAILARETATLAEPIRTTLEIGRMTYYFRTRFQFPSNPKGVELRLGHFIDDGCIVYLNGTEVLRTAMPDGPVTYDTAATRTVGDAAYEGPFTISSASLLRGENVLAVEVHQAVINSSDVALGIELDATIPAGAASLRINEVAANNRGSVRNGNQTPDWIELFNDSASAVDLAGMSLSDQVLTPGKYVFPPGTVMPPGSFLTVWCDSDSSAPGLHTGFALNDNGQTVALFGPGLTGLEVKDSVTFGLQPPDFTLGRVPGRASGWGLTLPTPGRANEAATTSPPSSLKINEWMAAPLSGSDWIELFNTGANPVELGGLFLTDDAANPANGAIAPLSFVAPGGFALFQADDNSAAGADHLGFKLGAGGEVLALLGTNGVSVIDSASFGPQASNVSQGRLPDGGARIATFPDTASPGRPNHLPIDSVVINELLTHSDPPLEDTIELLNLSSAPVNIGGWFLSDDLGQLKKLRIPDGTILPPGGFKVFFEYQFNPVPGSPGSFSLNSAFGDDLYLSAADVSGALTGYREHVDFGPSENGVSFGRWQTSTGVEFTALARRTFGQDDAATLDGHRLGAGLPNALPKAGPIVISEIMYHPASAGAGLPENPLEEFIELGNISSQPVPLFDPTHPANNWRIRGGVDFDLPPNLTIPPLGHLVLVPFNPAADPAARAAFEAKYGTGIPLAGPFSKVLGNAGDDLKLFKPDPPQTIPGPDYGFVPYVLVDRVQYADTPPWPTGADGLGLSLQKLAAAAYGNDPANWTAAAPTPGAPRNAPGNAADSDGDGLPDSWEAAHGLAVGVNDAALDPDGDGAGNLVEFLAGTDPQDAASRFALLASTGGNTVTLRFHAEAGISYDVQTRADILSGAWENLRQVPPEAAAHAVELVIPLDPSARIRFFRLSASRAP